MVPPAFQRPRPSTRACSPISCLCAAALAASLVGNLLGAGPVDPREELLWHRDASGTWQPVRTLEDWAGRRAAIGEAMTGVMGRFPADPPPEAPRPAPAWRVLDDEALDGFHRRHIEYESLPGEWVPAHLLVPVRGTRAGDGPWPAVLGLHQTHPAGRRVVVGLVDSPDDAYGVELARRGYVVLAPPYPLLADYQPDLKAGGFVSGTLRAVWDNIRALDLLGSLAEVRSGRGFGAIGHSLGGHNGLFTAAFDERIKVVVTSCGFDAFRDYYDGNPGVWQPERGWCQTRYMPGLAAYADRLEEIPFDFAEVLARIAPRAVWINAPVGDSNFRWQSVSRVVRSAREIYVLHHVSRHLELWHPDDPHRFSPEQRERAYAFIDLHLQ